MTLILTHHQQTTMKKIAHLDNKNNLKTEHAMKVNGMRVVAKMDVVSNFGSMDLYMRAIG